MLAILSANVPANFKRMANELFNNYIIQVNNNLYRLLEIEFYYNDSDKHKDTYTHKHIHQTEPGRWYFHGSGIDITFGRAKVYGGILIRGVEKITPMPLDKKVGYIFGPLKVKTELVSGFHSVTDDEPNTFRLVPALEKIEKVPEENIIAVPRIGLAAREGDAGKYHSAHYRFLIHPHLGHKNKTGIATALRDKWGSDAASLDRIKKLLGSEFLKGDR